VFERAKNAQSGAIGSAADSLADAKAPPQTLLVFGSLMVHIVSRSAYRLLPAAYSAEFNLACGTG
jgi:hypothetical protein